MRNTFLNALKPYGAAALLCAITFYASHAPAFNEYNPLALGKKFVNLQREACKKMQMCAEEWKRFSRRSSGLESASQSSQ